MNRTSRARENNDLNQFLWLKPRPPLAPRWIEWRDPPADHVASQEMNDEEYRLSATDMRFLVVRRELSVEAYEPLEEEPSLFRKFGDIQPTEQGFSAFVSEFGFLTHPIPLKHLRRYSRADFFVNLVWAHKKLKGAIDQFDSLRTQPLSSGLARKLRVEVNENLGSGFGVSAGGVTPRVVYRMDLIDKTEGVDLKLVPNSLLSAMWLQLAQEMTGNHTFKRCRGCKSWFKAGDVTDLNARRADAQLCGDPSCKMRAIRNREKEKANRRATPAAAQRVRRAK